MMEIDKFEDVLDDLLKNKFYTVDIPYGSYLKNIVIDKLPHENIKDISKIFTYNFDEYGYRYNTSKYNLNNKNKIFCFGCSQTMGNGIHFEETWPFLLGKNFGSEYNVYNYGVEAISNNGIFRRIYQFLKYLEFNSIDYPKYIFIYFTDFERDEFIGVHKNQIKIIDAGCWSGEKYEQKLKVKTSLYYIFDFFKNFKKIEEMCFFRGVKLYWSSWHPYFKFFSKKILQTYLNLNTILEEDYVKVQKFIDISRNGTHVGILTNQARANDFYEMVQKNI